MESLDFEDDGIGVEYFLAREAQASLWDTWQVWVRANARARLTEEGRVAYIPSFYLDQLLYQETARAAGLLDAAIERVVERTRFAANGVRDFQQSLTLVLVALALGGTLSLGLIGQRLREGRDRVGPTAGRRAAGTPRGHGGHGGLRGRRRGARPGGSLQQPQSDGLGPPGDL